MPGRGFARAVYVTDRGTRFLIYVDRDYLDDPKRGFTPAGSEPLVPIPQRWRPRFVIGLDSVGNEQRTRIGNVGAPLWTGSATTWNLEHSSLGTETATRIARVAERALSNP